MRDENVDRYTTPDVSPFFCSICWEKLWLFDIYGFTDLWKEVEWVWVRLSLDFIYGQGQVLYLLQLTFPHRGPFLHCLLRNVRDFEPPLQSLRTRVDRQALL